MIKWIISSTCLIFIMAVIRKLFQGKISPRLQYALWLLVAVRLLIPVNLGSSVLSIENVTDQLMNQTQREATLVNSAVPENFADSGDRIKIFDSIEEINTAGNVNLQIEQSQAIQKEPAAVSVTPTAQLGISEILLGIWGIGAGVTAVVFILSNKTFGKRVKRTRILIENQKEKLPVYEAYVVETPCLFGFLHPAIYVTNAVADDKNLLRHAVAHELTHYAQGDLFWSLLRCLCLTLHWYNPFVWWAAKLSKQDGELACDEATIRKLGEEERLAYGKTLIQLTCEKRQDLFVAATTMTSDKKSITERIQRIAKRRKIRIYALAGVLLVSVIAVGCTFTGASDSKDAFLNDSAVIRGGPCEEPEDSGWDISLAEDVRADFNKMSPEPNEGDGDKVYLLGETDDHKYRLYGKGDYQTMLVCMDEKYAEIDFPYASNYMELPRLIETDIDRDGKLELCIIVWLQRGTGLHIENLLLADFSEEENLYVYEFMEENYTKQLQEGLSYEITEEGIQPLVNNRPAGNFEKHPENVGPYVEASVGNNMRFDFDPFTGELRLRGKIMLISKDHPGGLFGNGNDITAKVCWDGKRFSLTNYTSSNRRLEEQTASSDIATNAEKIIERAEIGLREGYKEAQLTYADNEETGWNYYTDEPWNSEAERDALAQAALKELYTLTGYNVTECTYTTDGRSKFIFGKNGDYIRKCIAFYARDFGAELCGDSVPYQGFMNARKFHYSDVQQLNAPYDKEEYNGLAGHAKWYLEHSGVYRGESITGYERINQDDTVYTHVKLTFDSGYYIVVMDESIESCSEIAGPFYKVNENIEAESEVTEKIVVIKNKSYETEIQDKVYRQAMTDFLQNGEFPATAGVQCDGDTMKALYAVKDIDGDNREEFLLSFPDAEAVAGMCYYIYDYDRTTNKLYIQNSGYPDFTIYDNGYIKEEMSHNHGRSNTDDFWPYLLYYYNSETDCYEYVTSVDAWQEIEGIEPNPPFPKDKDLNGDGIVYYDNMAENYDNPQRIMDNEEYKKWCEKYNHGNEIKIQWYLAGGTESTLLEEGTTYHKELPKDQVCLAVMPDGISKAGGDYRYLIPEDQEMWVKAYQEMKEHSAGDGRWRDDEHSVGIWIVYNDEWTCLTDQGFIVDFTYRTELSDAQEFYDLCLNEAKKQGIQEAVKPEEIKNLVSAMLDYDGWYLLTDEKSLLEIQKAFSSSKEVRGGTACPFTASLVLKTEDGESRTIYLATDSCDTWLSSGVYYQYHGFEDIEEIRSYFNEHGTDISSARARLQKSDN